MNLVRYKIITTLNVERRNGRMADPVIAAAAVLTEQ